MGWSAILAADIEFENGTIDAWKALAIDDASYEKWGPLTAVAPRGVAATVGESLARLDEMARGCAALGGHDQLALTWHGRTLRVRGDINEDDYRSIARDLATVQRVGARGQYLALANDGNDGERTVIEGGTSRVESIALHDVLSGAATDPGGVDYAAVIEEIFASVQSAMMNPPKKKAAAAKKPAPKKPAVKKAAVKSKPASKKRAAPPSKKPARKKR